ncbi:MAG: M13 family metallopeptidase, partial [Acidobacteria bacterium]|nr:M13 family metallopeptidase [Acidobacteriota bacterium]
MTTSFAGTARRAGSLLAIAGATFLGAQTAAPPPLDRPVPGVDLTDMDKTAAACQNFFQYAVGGWTKKYPIPPEYPAWGTFQELAEKNRDALRKILERSARNSAAKPGPEEPAKPGSEEHAKPGSEEQKIGDFYASCMDETAIESRGLKPLAPELDRIAKIANLKDLQTEVARLQVAGVNALFQFGSEQDRKKSTDVIATAVQGGLGLPDRDYYTKTDDASKKIREQYLAHVTKVFQLAGDDAARAAANARTVMAIETGLAEASMTNVEQRDPDATYNRMEPPALKSLTPSFSWTAYFHDIEAPPALSALNVQQPKFFQALDKQLTTVPLAKWKTYLRWQLVATASPALSSQFVNEDFDFNQRILQGTEKIQPRWKRCVRATDGQLGFALGKIYVAEYFPPEAKQRADRMVRNLIAALRDDLATLPWMGPETRKAALAKLDAFNPKIGYPDKWRDYSTLQIDRGPYVVNAMRATRFEWARDLAKVGKPVDRTDWGMTPPAVNAYYNPLLNEIVFPAGILQPPFFNKNADDAVNYGGMGAVIGHEMTHGFDDQGRKFDAQGNLKNWWTDQDLRNYQERATCVEKQFEGYKFEGDQHLNGKLVLGESIADLGGLSIAYRAYQKSLEGKSKPAPTDGLTDDQRFFINWARVWAANDRPEFARLIVNTNPHPLDRFRAIGAPSNMPEFARAFSCKP